MHPERRTTRLYYAPYFLHYRSASAPQMSIPPNRPAGKPGALDVRWQSISVRVRRQVSNRITVVHDVSSSRRVAVVAHEAEAQNQRAVYCGHYRCTVQRACCGLQHTDKGES